MNETTKRKVRNIWAVAGIGVIILVAAIVVMAMPGERQASEADYLPLVMGEVLLRF